MHSSSTQISAKDSQAGKVRNPENLQQVLTNYKRWLKKSLLSEHSKRNYFSRITAFIKFLEHEQYLEITAKNKDELARQFKKFVKLELRRKPATLNSYIAALNNFFGHLAVGPTNVTGEDLQQESPRSLTKVELKKLKRAIDRTSRTKDRAILATLLYTAIRISELQKLELDDVHLVGRKTRLIVRSGKGDRYRELPLNSVLCEVLQLWLAERKQKFKGKTISQAFFTNPKGQPLCTQAIDKIVRKIGQDCGLELSAHVIRHSCLTSLLRNQNDVVLVADIAGHKNLKTTQRYTLPSAADKARALEELI